MKKILSVQDLSCLGKCSLTVALPVISAMGCACTVLPTAVLSTHTAFPDPHCRSLTEDIYPVARHWKTVGASFDAISVGYLADPEQAGQVEQVLALFDGTVVLDPVMGDGGKLYSRFTRDHIRAVKQLCSRADFLLPNLTEAALLTGLPYREDGEDNYLSELAQGLLELGSKCVVITGFTRRDGSTGFYGADKEGKTFRYAAKRIGKHFHGTGDLFAAVFTAALTRGKRAEDAACLAARFTERVIAATEESSPFGIAFEPELPWLVGQL